MWEEGGEGGSKGQNHFGMECALYGLGQDMDNGFLCDIELCVWCGSLW